MTELTLRMICAVGQSESSSGPAAEPEDRGTKTLPRAPR